MIHVCTPFSLDKDLGKVYNQEFARCPEDDWLCVIDYDVTFLTPRSIPIMYQYIGMFPETGIFTCRTNRIHPLAFPQLAEAEPSEVDSMRYWQEIAEDRESFFPCTTKITHEISGFLMLISKKTWNKIKFPETGRALGVDNAYSNKVLASGKNILCMEAIVVWHSYRLKDIKDKSHLKV